MGFMLALLLFCGLATLVLPAATWPMEEADESYDRACPLRNGQFPLKAFVFSTFYLQCINGTSQIKECPSGFVFHPLKNECVSKSFELTLYSEDGNDDFEIDLQESADDDDDDAIDNGENEEDKEEDENADEETVTTQMPSKSWGNETHGNVTKEGQVTQKPTKSWSNETNENVGEESWTAQMPTKIWGNETDGNTNGESVVTQMPTKSWDDEINENGEEDESAVTQMPTTRSADNETGGNTARETIATMRWDNETDVSMEEESMVTQMPTRSWGNETEERNQSVTPNVSVDETKSAPPSSNEIVTSNSPSLGSSSTTTTTTTTTTAVEEEEDVDLSCAFQNGVFVYPNDCRRFIVCTNWVPQVQYCPTDLEYDPSRRTCSTPANRKCRPEDDIY